MELRLPARRDTLRQDAITAVLGWGAVATVNDVSAVPRSLPLPAAPVLRLVPSLLIPALSLAFVGLVQGAGVSASFGPLHPGPHRHWQ